MYRNQDFIYEAVTNLEKLIDIPIDIEHQGLIMMLF